MNNTKPSDVPSPIDQETIPQEPSEAIIINKCDPITRKFKRVKTKRIRRCDFYSIDGQLIDENFED